MNETEHQFSKTWFVVAGLFLVFVLILPKGCRYMLNMSLEHGMSQEQYIDLKASVHPAEDGSKVLFTFHNDTKFDLKELKVKPKIWPKLGNRSSGNLSPFENEKDYLTWDPNKNRDEIGKGKLADYND